ncbi:MAG: iron response transcriptional regulator IrrA [Pseudomonadota bacterium]
MSTPADTTCLTVQHLRDIGGVLRQANLRPTRQRMALADLLFSKGNRHVSAEDLHAEALQTNVQVSLATIYNTLHQFTQAGLLRAVSVDSAKTYFDTNVTEHHHLFIEGENRVVDIPASSVEISELPAIPDNMEISRVDVVVRVRPKS